MEKIMAIKLTQNEKYIIQGRLHNGDSVKDIANSINRHAQTVQNFIDNQLDNIYETITKVQLEQSQQDPPDKKKSKKTPKRKPLNEGFISKTGGGNKGVTISTDAASSQSDHYKSQYPTELARTVRGNLYDINNQEVKK